MKALIISRRIIKQTINDKQLIFLSFFIPVGYIFLVSIFFDALPSTLQNQEVYAVPVSVFLVQFVTFILSVLVWVGEKRNNTLDRIYLTGINNLSMTLGYLIGYLAIATIQVVLIVITMINVFSFDYSIEKIIAVTYISWLMAIASVLIGLLVSNLTSREDQVIPFVPLILIPSFLFSGMVVTYDKLPIGAQLIGKLFPAYYANNALEYILSVNIDYSSFYSEAYILIFYCIALLLVNALVGYIKRVLS
ncbi:ABC transporter permease [Candidatus Dojkabacteria bacterium]|uniref:Transport permease protein n=1 Tax=Candidatus Dojkabacteria bacterium TaxID=2099670 RepID=A0A955RJ45_9BACT|nr:ABC transporter permease [Candidatus Dojkabacteria bacterium]